MDNNMYDDYYGDDGLPGRDPRPESPFYAPKKEHKKGTNLILKLWRLIYPVLIHGVGINVIVGVFVGVFMSVVLFTSFSGGENAAYDFIYDNQIALSGAAEVLVFIPLLGFFLRDEKQRKAYTPDDCLTKRKMKIADWLTVFAFVMSLTIVVNLFVAMLNLPQSSAEQEMEEIYKNTSVWVELVVVGIVAPFCEEMVFRGLVFRRLRDDIDPLFAAILSGLAFGIYHGNLEQGIFASILGIIFAMLYEHYGTIAVPIAAHMLNNLYATLANEFIYGGEFEMPDAAYYVQIVLAIVAVGALAIFIFKDDEKCNQY